MNRMTTITTLIALWAGATAVKSEARAEHALSSPDGRTQVSVAVDGGGRLTYRVSHDDRCVLEPSPIGVILDGIDLGKEAVLEADRPYKLDLTYPWRGKVAMIAHQCQGLVIPIDNKYGISWQLELRAYDDGVAYRCVIPGNEPHKILGEAAAWIFPEGTTIWCQDNIKQYEGLYARYELSRKQADRPYNIGMPVTALLPGGGYACLSEAEVMGYSGMTLKLDERGVLQGVFSDDPKGWSTKGQIATPWRVLIVADDLNELVNSTIVYNVCDPPDRELFPQGINTDWLVPGRCLWQWWAYDSDGVQWEKQKEFVDKAAQLKCRYYLVDDGWCNPKYGWFGPENNPWVRMKELCDYAAKREVGIWIWMAWHSGQHAPGLETPEQRANFFKVCADTGVVGTKIDFMDSESHDRLAFYEDCLRQAAKHKIMIDFHGANKPAGEARTWPNEMTREGVRGLEYNKWSTLPPAHYATLPFTRMVVGHADFTPTTFQKHMLKGTTSPCQLACAVVYTSPLLCWADKPDVYLDSQADYLIKRIPAVWDETRVLPGSMIGELAAFARRDGGDWWVGIINGGDQAKEYTLKLDFLGSGIYDAIMVRDVPGQPEGMKIDHDKVKADSQVNIHLEPGGGFVAMLQKESTQ